MSNLDETELARLEALAAGATTLPWKGDGHKECGYGWVKIPGCNTTGTERSARLGQYLGADDDANYIAAACNAVPTLVAEVRRLRACKTINFEDFEHHLESAQAKEISALREKVEAWEWYNECRVYDPWREHPYWTACGRSSHLRKDQNSIGTRRARALENAVAEWHAIVEAARESVHADRE